MEVFEGIGIAVLVLLAALVVVFGRRELIVRHGGTIEMNMRLSRLAPGRGWAPGLGRFAGDELRWYRVFSFGFRPRRVLCRSGLTIDDRRAPVGAERLAMPAGWIVLRCTRPGATGSDGPVELALAESALTGFQSWIESAPPGGATHH